MLGFTGDGVFLLTLAFLMKDSITSVAPVLATAHAAGAALAGRDHHRPDRRLDRRSLRRAALSIVNGVILVAGFALIALGHEVIGALVVVMTRGMFNTLIPVLVIERGKAACCPRRRATRPGAISAPPSVRSSAPWLFLNVPQGPLYAALAAALGISAWFAWPAASFCCHRRVARHSVAQSSETNDEHVLGVAHLREHRERGIAGPTCRPRLHRGHVGAQERVGGFLLAEQRRHRGLAARRARRRRGGARAISCLLSVSTVTAKRAFDCVYSCAQ